MRTELFEDRVYALTPKGEVIDLPRGATPLDFAYQIHTSLGHRCKGAKVNGRIVPLTYTLENGEVVEIITGKLESPSRDWLAPEQGYLGSPHSRTKVRAWFRKQEEAAQPPAPAAAPAPSLEPLLSRPRLCGVAHARRSAERQLKLKVLVTCQQPWRVAARRCVRSP